MMKNGMPEKNNTPPLILIISQRKKMVRILTAGFNQGHYRTIHANSPYTAGIKANQYVPGVVIFDITKENIKDLAFVSRLHNSSRTKNVAILILVTKDVNTALKKSRHLFTGSGDDDVNNNINLLQYPFPFEQLLKKTNNLLGIKKQFTPPAVCLTDSLDSIEQMLFDPQIKAQSKLIKIEEAIIKKWAFPHTVIKALDIIESESGGCKDLGKCIETDVAAASSVIRIANAVHYSKRDSRISNAVDAVVRIGFCETRNLLACLALIDMSPDIHKRYGFNRQDFWLHSLATAIIAEKLSKLCEYDKPELAFISGLIHDLGMIPLDINFNTIFPRLLEETTNELQSFHHTELNKMGFTHADLGLYLTTSWKFPKLVPPAVGNHHNPQKILTSSVANERVLQEAVFAANILAKALELGHSCDEVLGEIPQKMLNELSIPNGPSQTFFDQVDADLKLFCGLLKLPIKNTPFVKKPEAGIHFDFAIVLGTKLRFHPLQAALKNRQYAVKTISKITPEIKNKTNVVIYIQDKNIPLDITITEDMELADNKPGCMEIFLLEGINVKESISHNDKDDVLLLNRTSVDLRIILQAYDRYLEDIDEDKKCESEDDVLDSFFDMD